MDFEGVRPRRARAALRHVTGLSTGPAVDPDLRITLNLHPDRLCGGLPVLRSLARDGAYHSQFVTGTSNGGLTAHPGGDRRRWESRIFGGAYDDAPATERPVYGALDFRRQVVGAAPRFGSSHFRLTAAALTRATFCYPDSAAEPADFGTAAAMALVAVAGPMSGTPSTTTSKPRSTAASTSPGTSRRWSWTRATGARPSRPTPGTCRARSNGTPATGSPWPSRAATATTAARSTRTSAPGSPRTAGWTRGSSA